MLVKELIEELKQYDPNADLAFVINPAKTEDIAFDVRTTFEIRGTKDCPEAILTLQDKSNLESISELLEDTDEELVIKIDKNGVFVFKDDYLVREIELKSKYVKDNYLNNKPEEYIKMLLRIL